MEEDIQKIIYMRGDLEEMARKDGNIATWNPERSAGEKEENIMVSMNICTSMVDAMVAIR
jgi:hypothetical protein